MHTLVSVLRADVSYFLLHFFKSSLKDMVIDFKRGREGEGEKHRSVASPIYPNWGPNLQPRHVP